MSCFSRGVGVRVARGPALDVVMPDIVRIGFERVGG